MLATAVITAYVWVFSTFATQEENAAQHMALEASITQVSTELRYHIDEALLWRINTRIEDLQDRRDELEREIQAGNDSDFTQSNKRDLDRRIQRLQQQVQCLQNNGSHCLDMENPT
jgi:hypothetical protein